MNDFTLSQGQSYANKKGVPFTKRLEYFVKVFSKINISAYSFEIDGS